jgi:lichenan operon transcriptional antiterminator
MNHQGYVSTTFKDDVLKREALSSTAFVKDIAVPHPLKPVTAHTTMAFVLNHKPMQWGDSYVRIIVLLGLSPNDHDEFQVIFDALIAALSNADTVQKLLDTQSYTEIIDILRDSVVYSG